MDKEVRDNDTLAGPVQVMQNIASPVSLEGDLARVRAAGARNVAGMADDPTPSMTDSDFEVVVNAARFVLDYVACRPRESVLVIKLGRRGVLSASQSALRSLRNSCCTPWRVGPSMHARLNTKGAYGGVDAYKVYRLAPHWRVMIADMEDHGLVRALVEGDNTGSMILRGDGLRNGAQAMLKSWRLLPATLVWLGLATASVKSDAASVKREAAPVNIEPV